MTVHMVQDLLTWCRGTGHRFVWVDMSTGSLMKYEVGSGPINYNGHDWTLFDSTKAVAQGEFFKEGDKRG